MPVRPSRSGSGLRIQLTGPRARHPRRRHDDAGDRGFESGFLQRRESANHRSLSGGAEPRVRIPSPPYKEKVKPASFGLKEVMQMQPVTFKWKDRDEKDFGLVA